jgi:hypothetical protein
MTAEVCVMNRVGVALAADSAVTLRPDGKIYTSVEKLFALSEHAPVGIMVYGNADFTDVPWETLVKTFRSELGKHTFSGLDEYVAAFITFLKDRKSVIDIKMQERCLRSLSSDYVFFWRYLLNKKISEATSGNQKVSASQVEKMVIDLVNAELEMTRQSDLLDEIDEQFAEVIKSEYGGVINEVVTNLLGELPGIAENEQLIDLIASVIASRRSGGLNSGVVVAGFGTDDIYPQVSGLSIDGMEADRLLYSRERTVAVDSENRAWIIPFAQQEMVHTFMEGVDPELLELFSQATLDMLQGMASILVTELRPRGNKRGKDVAEKLDATVKFLHEELLRRLTEKRQLDYNAPVMQIVAALPKDELAGMAEALVNLTKFKRRVSRQAETVAGPIDVAVISKGDGFVWIKRKHYFDAALNPRFIARYYQP